MKKKLLWLFVFCVSVAVQAQVAWKQEITERLNLLMDDELMESAQVGLMVWDLTSDSLLYEHKPHYLMRTASTMKAVTAITALDCLGGDYKFNTSLYYSGTLDKGVLNGDLICVGGMDPMLDDSDIKAMVGELKRMGVKRIRGKLVTDLSMKSEDKWGEGWCWDDDNPTLSPLLVSGEPVFAERFLTHLREAQIAWPNVKVESGTLPDKARLVMRRCHTIDEVLFTMMKDSDNLFAEALYYQIAAQSGHRPATAEDARKVVTALMEKIKLDPQRYRLADGSGLSLYNYLSPACETMFMRYAWQHEAIRSHLLPALPVAGVDGTLKKRMKNSFAEANVMAKTGTVTGVSTLTGYLTASNAHVLCFSIMVQGIRRAVDGRRFQDRFCVALATPLDVEIELIWNQLEYE